MEPTYFGCEWKELSDLFEVLGQKPIKSLAEYNSIQDWELVFANPKRVLEFAEIYGTHDLSKCQRFELGCLLFASLDDAVSERGVENCAQEIEALRSIVESDYELHEYHVCYWALVSTTGEGWAITPIAAKMLRS